MLCGLKWYDEHKEDHTQEEIDGLGIVISINGKPRAKVSQGEKKGAVKHTLRQIEQLARDQVERGNM